MRVWVNQSSLPVTGLPASLPSPSAGPTPERHRGFEVVQRDVVFRRSLSRLPLLWREALFAAVGAGIHGWAPAGTGGPPVCGCRLGHMGFAGERGAQTEGKAATQHHCQITVGSFVLKRHSPGEGDERGQRQES